MDAVLSSSSAWVWRDAITAVFWLAVAALAIGTARRAALWRTGLAAPVAWRGLLAIPKRYFVDLHHVVAREPAVARAHVAVAGGAIACLALVAINDGLRLRLAVLDMALVAFALVMLAGTLMMALRRRRGRWARARSGCSRWPPARCGTRASRRGGRRCACWLWAPARPSLRWASVWPGR